VTRAIVVPFLSLGGLIALRDPGLCFSENDLGNAVAATEAADIVFMKFRRFIYYMAGKFLIYFVDMA